MYIVSQDKRCAVKAQSIRLKEDIRLVADSFVHAGYDIWANESTHVAKYKSGAQAQQVFAVLRHKLADGEDEWYWMPEDDQP